ncbi:MAG: hypothetical protein QOK26_432, partial [Pseudonocardiales bacterium]|nr:hypothetical protein [Pseudonocardiales bacterium]MDT7644422.1 hypothetical protein [Pseudonocardiales bacterium]
MSAERVAFSDVAAQVPVTGSPVPPPDLNRNAELVRSSFVAMAPRLDKVLARFYAVL